MYRKVEYWSWLNMIWTHPQEIAKIRHYYLIVININTCLRLSLRHYLCIRFPNQPNQLRAHLLLIILHMLSHYLVISLQYTMLFKLILEQCHYERLSISHHKTFWQCSAIYCMHERDFWEHDDECIVLKLGMTELCNT